ncbi:MAG: hydantoinase/oxoprolinase family protein [Deltaproteobacteria bacterium]|nr:hydantoinase/oxoprolinase family protein [Deltaproteobacteria bacterium]
MAFKLGIDVGDTFTDLFLWSSDGRIETHKTLSTPADPSIGLVDGLRALADRVGMEHGAFAKAIGTIVHGTTVTTNATLVRGGAKTGLFTTEGVRDALEMRRGIREAQYDNRYQNVTPLVPRALRLPVKGRLDRDGKELTTLDLDDVKRGVATMRQQGVGAVAVCFMNSFANPAHERAAAEVVRAAMPEAFLSISSEVLPTVRFYNRISTTVMNAYVGPILKSYLDRLTTRLAEFGFGGVLLIMQSSGGVALPSVTMGRPAATLLSGPAGAPAAAAAYTQDMGNGDCVVVDMGGTSFDASLVRGGEAAMRNEGDIDRLRIALPMLEITTIGAGGGSVAWIDEGGLLRMGPESAGAMPGPACYGRGGERPCVTDANVVLGYLDPSSFAGGRLTLDVEAARRAITERVAKPLGLTLEQAAAGMYRVVNANMAHGVREVTVRRGIDPRGLPLVVAGGAGPLHACMIADELEIASVVVPPTASVLCATGMVLSDLRHDFARSCLRRFSALDFKELNALLAELTVEAEAQLQAEGVEPGKRRLEPAFDLRYLKQYHEVTVSLSREDVAKGDLAAAKRAFHAEHNRLFGYDLEKEGTDIELITVRLKAVGATDKPTLPRVPPASGEVKRALVGARRAFVPEDNDYELTPIYQASKLLAGDVIAGPALIERVDTTIVVTRSFTATIDSLGSARLTRNAVREG